MGTSGTNPLGFWRIVGRAVDNQQFLNAIKRNPGEDVNAWQARITPAINNVDPPPVTPLHNDDWQALKREYNGKTIIDLIYECKNGWATTAGSYRT